MINNKKIKVIRYAWWIFMIIGIIIGLANSDSRYRDSQPIAMALVGAINGALFGVLIGFLIDQVRKSTIVKKLAQSIEQNKVDSDINRSIQNSMNNYKDAAHRFQYLSNETLMEKFENEQVNEADNMERLALEEEMVKRRLIDYSPMHEKLEKLKDYFKQ